MMMKIVRGAAILGAIGLAVAAVQDGGLAIPVLTVGGILIAGLGVAVYGFGRAMWDSLGAYVAAESLKYAKKGRIHTGIGTSSYHIYDKLNSNPEEILERAVAAAEDYISRLAAEASASAEGAKRKTVMDSDIDAARAKLASG